VNWGSGNNMADVDADHMHWVKALGTMASWGPRTVAVGHGTLGDVSTLQKQAAYIEDMWKQVSEGKRRGKTAEELAKTLDFTKHQPVGADVERNAVAVRAMFAKAGAR